MGSLPTPNEPTMRNRSRLLMLLAPWFAGSLPRDALAQPNTNVPSGGPGGEQGEVQVGAGTQGDVTTGSSGSKPKSSGNDGGKREKKDKAAVQDRDATRKRPTDTTAGRREADR
jgi:hypothetical protein